MADLSFTSYRIEERSFAAYIKREIHNLVRDHFSDTRTGEIDIVVSEIVSNLVKHANSGELLYRLIPGETAAVFDLICIDSGPGIRDVGAMMKDGKSTTRTLGQGLGAINRLANFSQVYSQCAPGDRLCSIG